MSTRHTGKAGCYFYKFRKITKRCAARALRDGFVGHVGIHTPIGTFHIKEVYGQSEKSIRKFIKAIIQRCCREYGRRNPEAANTFLRELSPQLP